MANTIDSAVSFAALNRTQNSAVRTFAEMMIRDHTQANQQEAQLLQRAHIAPAMNELSQGMLQDVQGLAAMAPDTRGMMSGNTGKPATAQPATAQPRNSGYDQSSTVTTTTTTTATAPNAGRDTLHLSNPFVAAVNMQPWSSLLTGPLEYTVGVNGTMTTSTTSITTTTPATGAMAPKPAPTANAGTSVGMTTTQASDFDRKYAEYQVNFHQKVLDALDQRLIPWAGPEQRSVLEAARPTVVAHLEQARALQRSLNNNATH